MVLAELSGGVSQALKQPANRGVELAHSHGSAGETDLAQSGPDDVLASEKRGATSGARLLAVVLEEANAFLANAVDVRRFVAHQAVTVGADVGDADVIAPDDEYVRLVRALREAARRRNG